MKRRLGIVLLLLMFIGLYVFLGEDMGYWIATKAIATTFGVSVAIGIAISLINSGK